MSSFHSSSRQIVWVRGHVLVHAWHVRFPISRYSPSRSRFCFTRPTSAFRTRVRFRNSYNHFTILKNP
jgi:hypothetical protein